MKYYIYRLAQNKFLLKRQKISSPRSGLAPRMIGLAVCAAVSSLPFDWILPPRRHAAELRAEKLFPGPMLIVSLWPIQ